MSDDLVRELQELRVNEIDANNFSSNGGQLLGDEPGQHLEKKRKTFEDLFNEHMKLIADCETLNYGEKNNLGALRVDQTLYETVTFSSLKQHKRFKPLHLDSYNDSFSFLLDAEFAHSEIDLRRFDQESAFVQQIEDGTTSDGYNQVVLPNLIHADRCIIPVIFFALLTAKQDSSHRLAQIKSVDDNVITFNVANQLVRGRYQYKATIHEGHYKIRFMSDGLIWRRARRALCHSARTLRESIFRADDNNNQQQQQQQQQLCTYKGVKIDIDTANDADNWLKLRLAKRNELQLQAIEKIFEAKCRPGPYIVFGPPGTGKTTTLVELVVQIYHRQRGSKILLTGGSNLCVDKLALDLESTGLIDSMCRFASMANLKEFAKKNQEPPKYFQFDAKEAAASFRVVVTTNNMSGASKFLESQFDFVIIDEAGHSSEPEVLISMNRCRRDGCIVLAGDPEQLGPVVKCKEALELGLGRSLLVRLTRTVDNYKFRQSAFDERYITRLAKSYRCDERILELNNKLFYNGELKCLGQTPPSILRMLQVDNPRLFVNVADGYELSQVDSLSRYNPKEIQVCVEQIVRLYKMGLEPHQIGVITPYKLHREKMIEALGERLKLVRHELNEQFNLNGKLKNSTHLIGQQNGDCHSNDMHSLSTTNGINQEFLNDWSCKIGTVDGFHGGEREVILISLVRTPDSLGNGCELDFINDENRFNVSLSRAKWVNMVIAHEAVMKVSPIWSQYSQCAQQLEARELLALLGHNE